MGFSLKKIGAIAANPLTLGTTLVGGGLLLGGEGGIKDFLLGKKQGGFSADAISQQIRDAQAKGILTSNKGLDKLNQTLETDGGELVAAQARKGLEAQKKSVVTSAQDARRRAQEMIAQRGLQGSSLGLAADRSRTQEAGNQMGAIQSQYSNIPLLMREQSLKEAQMLQQAGQGTFANLGGTAGINFHGQEGSRSGGLLGVASALAPVAGTIAGGMFGGPIGAAAGGQMGSGIGATLQSPSMANKASTPTGSTGYFNQSNPYGR